MGRPRIHCGLDFGTTKIAHRWNIKEPDKPPIFDSEGEPLYFDKRDSEEFARTVIRVIPTKDAELRFSIGDDDSTTAGVFVFRSLKVAIEDRRSREQMERDIAALNEKLGVKGTAHELNFRKLLTEFFVQVFLRLGQKIWHRLEVKQNFPDIPFEGIPKTVTIPIPLYWASEPRQFLAHAVQSADKGIESVDFIQEPTAALLAVDWKENVEVNSAIILIDCGGGTTDCDAISYKDDKPVLVAYRGSGCNQGAEDLNRYALMILSSTPAFQQYLPAEMENAICPSDRIREPPFHRCKTDFTGEHDLGLVMPSSGEVVPLARAIMEKIYEPQLSMCRGLIEEQANEARKQGLTPNRLAVVGGVAGNAYFIAQLKKYFPKYEVQVQTDYGVIAKGALSYSLFPGLMGPRATDFALGVTYLSDDVYSEYRKSMEGKGKPVSEEMGYCIAVLANYGDIVSNTPQSLVLEKRVKADVCNGGNEWISADIIICREFRKTHLRSTKHCLYGWDNIDILPVLSSTRERQYPASLEVDAVISMEDINGECDCEFKLVINLTGVDLQCKWFQRRKGSMEDGWRALVTNKKWKEQIQNHNTPGFIESSGFNHRARHVFKVAKEQRSKSRPLISQTPKRV